MTALLLAAFLFQADFHQDHNYCYQWAGIYEEYHKAIAANLEKESVREKMMELIKKYQVPAEEAIKLLLLLDKAYENPQEPLQARNNYYKHCMQSLGYEGLRRDV